MGPYLRVPPVKIIIVVGKKLKFERLPAGRFGPNQDCLQM